MREFESGATRDDADGKLDFEGFLSPLVLTRYAEYLHKHRTQADGKLRDSDNWQRGIPKDTYMKSKIRHGVTTHLIYDGFSNENIEDSLCAELFNTMGYLFELLKEEQLLLSEEDKQAIADALPPLKRCECTIKFFKPYGWCVIRNSDNWYLCETLKFIQRDFWFKTRQQACYHLNGYLETLK